MDVAHGPKTTPPSLSQDGAQSGRPVRGSIIIQARTFGVSRCRRWPLFSRRVRLMATAPDFWTMVTCGSASECWPWKRAVFHMGHGAVHFEGKQDRAHRVAWRLTNGPIPDGLCVLHHCDNPPCCNPSHLFLGTKTDNSRDRDRKGRQARGLRSGRYTQPHRTARGERNGRAKIKEFDVVSIRQMRKDGATLSSIAAKFGISTSQAHRTANGKSWNIV